MSLRPPRSVRWRGLLGGLLLGLGLAGPRVLQAQVPRPAVSPYAAFVGQRIAVEDVVAEVATTASGIPVLVLGAPRPREQVLVYLRPQDGTLSESWQAALRVGTLVAVRGTVGQSGGSYTVTVQAPADLQVLAPPAAGPVMGQGAVGLRGAGQQMPFGPPVQMGGGAYGAYGAYGPPVDDDYARSLPGAKDPGLAVLLSFLLTGAGQMYAGEVGRGVTMLLVPMGVGAVSVGIASASCSDGLDWNSEYGSSGCESAAIAALGVTAIVALGSWIYSMADANDAVRRHNAKLARQVIRPYLGQGAQGTGRVGLSVGF